MAYEANKFFLTRIVGEQLEFLRNGVTRLHPRVLWAGQVFETNLMDVFATASWPFLTAFKAVQQIRESASATHLRESDAEISGAAIRVLSTFLENQAARFAANALLHGCTVLSWSAFEILATDLFEQLLNSQPALAKVLFADERTKKFYDRKAFLIGALEANRYDLSSCLGTVLLEQQRLDKLEVIRGVYDSLFPTDEDLRGFLNSDDLWRVSRHRNLIAHRHGVVDEEFRRTTGSTAAIGGVLHVTPEQLEFFVVTIGRAGLALLNAATNMLQRESAKTALIEMGHDELGRRLLAAVMSHRLGLKSVDYTLKTYVKEPVSSRWVRLAEDLDREMAEGLGKLLSSQSGIVT